MVLTEKDFQEWKVHPTTVEFFKFLEALKREVMSDWADSHFVGESSDETVQRNSHALGEVFVLDKLIKVEEKDIVEVLYDNRE